MSSADKHLTAGAIVGLLAYAGYRHYNGEAIKLEEVVKAAIMGGISAMIPDVIEPPTDSNHRSVFHSLAALLSGCYGTTKGLQNCHTDEVRELLIAGFAGYSSHIILDGTTPKGVPLI